jgi:glycosyltransferase involved in cell wall biosynthesis
LDTWGEGRTFQKVAEELSALPQVGKVVVVFPPNKTYSEYSLPLELRRVNNKLALVSVNETVVPGIGFAFRFRSWLNDYAFKHALPKYLKYVGFARENTFLWLFPPHPYMDLLTRKVPHSLLIAHIVDNFLHHSDPWLRGYASQQYSVLKSFADVIITGSVSNYDYFSENRSATLLFENAVDRLFLSSPSTTPVSDGVIRLGYVGTLSERTDFDLLELLARTRPYWKIIIAGKSECPLVELGFLKYSNVEYVGVVKYDELPNLLRGFDVCLIPHKNTEYSRSMSPLKLFQYLASGRPIVSTEVAGLDSASKHLYVATSHDDFISKIEKALKEDTIEMSAQRIDLAKNETWEVRVSGMFDAVLNSFHRA